MFNFSDFVKCVFRVMPLRLWKGKQKWHACDKPHALRVRSERDYKIVQLLISVFSSGVIVRKFNNKLINIKVYESNNYLFGAERKGK